MADYRHRIVAAVAFDVDNVTPLPDCDDRCVRPKPCGVDTQHNWCRLILIAGALHGVVHRLRRDELIVARVREFAIDFYVRL